MQVTLLADQPHDVLAQAVSLLLNSFGPHRSQLFETGSVERVSGVDAGENDTLNFLDELCPDPVFGAQVLDELLRKITCLPRVGLLIADLLVGTGVVRPVDPHTHAVDMLSGTPKKAA